MIKARLMKIEKEAKRIKPPKLFVFVHCNETVEEAKEKVMKLRNLTKKELYQHKLIIIKYEIVMTKAAEELYAEFLKKRAEKSSRKVQTNDV